MAVAQFAKVVVLMRMKGKTGVEEQSFLCSTSRGQHL